LKDTREPPRINYEEERKEQLKNRKDEFKRKIETGWEKKGNELKKKKHGRKKKLCDFF